MITLFYFVSSVAVSLFAYLYFSYDHFKPGIIPYLAFYWIYIGLVYCLRHKAFWNKSPNFLFLFLSSLPLITSEPLFENDHLRYLWEGKVLSYGHDPYQVPPADGKLSHIPFERKEHIGFPSISSIYPPIAQLYFSLLGRLPYKWSLGGFQLINLFLVLGLIFYLHRKNIHPWKIALFFPYLQKEFINSIHIDLLMAVFFLTAYELRLRKEISKLSFSFSFLTKITSLMLFPFLYLKRIRFKELLILIPLFLICAWTMFPHGQVGLVQFGKHWLWAPGMPSLFTSLFGLTIKSGKTISLIIFIFIYLGIYFKFWREKISREKAIVISLMNLFFFAPVLNTWYTILLLPFALLTRSGVGILMVLFSSNSYIQWLMPHQLVILGTVHLPYFIFLYQRLMRLQNR